MSNGGVDDTAARKAFLDEYAEYLIVGFLLIGALGGYLVFDTMTTPDVETESVTQTSGSWATDSNFSHGATVRRPTSVFPEGRYLSDRPIYLSTVTPILEGEYAIEHWGVSEPVSGSIQLDLVLRSTETIDGTSFTHWETSDTIDSAEFESLSPGESERVMFEVNVSNLSLRISAIESELGASPGSTEIRLVADARLEGEVNEWQLLDRRTESLSIDPRGEFYSVSEEVQGQRSKERTERIIRETPVETSPIIRYGGPLLLIVGVLGAGGIGLGRVTDSFMVDQETTERLSFRRAYAEYEEWISTGPVPEESGNRTIVMLQSLEDVVDAAIDTNNRVIEDRDTDRFTVLTESVRYVYVPPWIDADDDDSADEHPGKADDAGGEST